MSPEVTSVHFEGEVACGMTEAGRTYCQNKEEEVHQFLFLYKDKGSAQRDKKLKFMSSA